MIGLEEIMKIHNISVTELAKELKISRGNIYSWFNGTRKVPESTLLKLCEIFNVQKEYITDEFTDTKRNEIWLNKIENKLEESSFKYDDVVIDENGKEKIITKDYIDNSLLDLRNEISDALNIKRIKSNLTIKINKVLMDDSKLEKIEPIFNSLLNIIDNNKIPYSVVKSVLKALQVAYNVEQNDKLNNFQCDLVEVITKNVRRQEEEKKKIDELIKSEGLEDLF